MVFEDFLPLIRSIASRAYYSNLTLNTREDVEQELSVKLTEIWEELGSMTREKAFSYVKVNLNNRLIDLLRSEKTRNQKRDVFKDLEDEADPIMETLAVNWLEDLIEADVETNLLEGIGDWMSRQSEDHRRFVQEAINPSPEMEKKWGEMQLSYARYRSYETPPPSTRARMLGTPAHQRALKSLREYLIRRGHLKT